MAHINRRFIDKHWLMFIIRGVLAAAFGCMTLFSGITEVSNIIAIASVFLLFMGIMDAVGALYSSTRKHGWINSIIDALIDIIAAMMLLFCAKGSLTNSVVILSVYTVVSGLVDIFHGFLSTVDPTDRFIRVVMGISGCIIGIVILNSGGFEITTFMRFFGAYMLIVGMGSMVYGAHNRAQWIEDRIARSESHQSKSKIKKTTKATTKKASKKRK